MKKSFDDVKSTVIGTRNKSSQFVTEGTKSFNEIEIKPIEWIKGNQLPAAGRGGIVRVIPFPKKVKMALFPEANILTILKLFALFSLLTG